MEYEVKDNKYNTVKDVLTKEFKFSKRLITKLKKENRIFVNNNPCFVNYVLKINDIVQIDFNFVEECDNIIPTKIELNIVYEDDYLLILNKPAKMETHPTCLNYENTLSNGIKYYYDSINLKRKIRPVSRLDKDTSGLIVFAKDQYIQEELIKQMKEKVFQKEYIAVVEGFLEKDKGEIVANIARKENSILERCISENGAYAKTYYEVLERLENKDSKVTVVKLKLETGRTHQIRVHMKHIGHPLVGDFLYGKVSNLIDRQALHCNKIEFIHPILKEKEIIEIPIAEDISKLLLKYK